ncbi:MAG: hypothetical protein WBY88_17865 [Desulfosarcina sp.]
MVLKTVCCSMVFWVCLLGSTAVGPVAAQESDPDPTITLSVQNQTLGDVLEEISRETGYRFELDRNWQDHPVSAAISNLPIEQALKRLLRSLNYTILWEANRLVTIQVFGRADPNRSGSAISSPDPSQPELDDAQPMVEPEPPSAEEEPAADGAEAPESNPSPGEEATPESAADESTPEQDDRQAPSEELSE